MAEARSITFRLADAKAKMTAKSGMRGMPNAYYLGPADWSAFMATEPNEITALFRGLPRQELGFDGVPVRQTKGLDQRGKSRLYSLAGTGIQVPE